MENKKEQYVWVKGVVESEGGLGFWDSEDNLVEYIPYHEIHKLDIYTDDKVTIPKFVADWIEETKKVYNLYGVFGLIKDKSAPPKILGWFSTNPSVTGEILARAWLDGYEIEKEKLYLVEIPDPNPFAYKYTFLTRGEDGTVYINRADSDYWKKLEKYQLTESEIKQDFAWAWEQGFAKEVKQDD